MDFSLANPLDGALLLAGGLILVALLAWRLRAQRGTPASRPGRPRTLDAVDTVIGWPPEATRVLTVRHQRAMEVLRRAMPGHLILAQVPLSHFIKVPTRLSYVEWLRRVGGYERDVERDGTWGCYKVANQHAGRWLIARYSFWRYPLERRAPVREH